MEWDPKFRWIIYALIIGIASLVSKEAFKGKKKEAMKMTKKQYIKKYSDGTHGGDREAGDEWEDIKWEEKERKKKNK